MPRVVSVADRTSRLTLVGWCGATEAQIRQGLSRARRGDWGALTCWPGSYLAVSTEAGRTVLVNDLAGVWPVHHMAYRGGWLWATTVRPLVALRAARIDAEFLTGLLAVPLVEELRQGRSAWEGVRSVPPGHALVLSRGRAAAEPYATAVDTPRDFPSAASRLREALTEAVSLRTRQARVVTADLSGGLDSTTVAVLAGPQRPVFTVTYTDRRICNDDDVRHADTAVQATPGLEQHMVHGDDSALPYGRLTDIPPTDAPCLDVLTLARRTTYLTPAARRGSTVHLTGNGGDAVLSTSPAFLADLVTSGRHREAVRETMARARLWKVTAHRLLRAVYALGRSSYPEALLLLADQLNGTGKRPTGLASTFSWTVPSAAVSWLLPEARVRLARRIAELERSASRNEPPGQWRDWRGLRWFGAGHAQYVAVGELLGLDIASPFLDNSVVRATLTLPSWQRAAARQLKPQLRAAMAGRLPESILTRRTKATFTSHGYAGLRAHREELRALLEGSRLAALGLLDSAKAIAALERGAEGLPTSLAALDSVLAAEAWSQAGPHTGTWWRTRREPRDAPTA